MMTQGIVREGEARRVIARHGSLALPKADGTTLSVPLERLIPPVAGSAT